MAERVIRNVENDYLMCSICLGRYRDPRLLPCGHSFCRQCLDDHIRQTITNPAAPHFMCPNDRTQIGRPSVGVPPRKWADVFPVDTFLSSLLNAVMIHASGSQSGETGSSVCKLHKNRVKEFYCMNCKETACALCIVKNHKGTRCDCVSIDEAIDKMRPRLDSVRNTLQRQIQNARQFQRGDEGGDVRLTASKERVLSELVDLETKMTYYYRTAKQQIEDMKLTVREAGQTMVQDSAHVSVMVTNISDTIKTYDDTCDSGSGVDILQLLPKIEGQVKEYENALKTLYVQPPGVEVNFVVNKHTERIFENIPSLGSLVIQSPDKYGHQGYVFRGHHANHSARGQGQGNARMLMQSLSLDSLETARSAPSPRSTSSSSYRPESMTPRTGRSDNIQTRPKVTVSVNTVDQQNTSWQLTGIAVVQDSLIITDAHNSQVFKIDTRPNGNPPGLLAIDCPVCVALGHGVSDAMVTQPEHKKLSLIETTDELIIKDTYETVKPYEGIARLPDGKYAVSCCVVDRQCIDVIDGDASILHTIDKDDSGNLLLSWPRFLSATNIGEILVSDRDKRSLLCFTPERRVKWTFPTSASPWGVSCHPSGAVYMCLDNNEVQVLSEDGRLVERGFVGRRDGISVSYAIHAAADFIAVTEWGSNLFSPSSPRVHMFAV
ncbi:tripartite motif-containing protein 3-like [Mya arenaria]|nr:tripartite motif-containing protein 3-like [Mya arenaria]